MTPFSRVAFILFFAIPSVNLLFQDGDKTSLVITENAQQLEFDSLENGIALFRKDDQSHVSIELSKLSADNLKKVMEFTGWGRVWEDSTGKHRTIADLVSVVSETVVLEKLDGKAAVIPLDRLSKADREYAEARRKLSTEALPERFVAKVVSIHDGDTVTVLLNRRQYKVRISGIDAPETGQDFSAKAKKHLGDFIHGKLVSGTRESTDQYGRNIATIYANDSRVDLEMLKNGLAWHYTAYSSDSVRSDAENVAQLAKLNIWSEANPVAPWEWRKWGTGKKKDWMDSQLALKNPPPQLPSKLLANSEPSGSKPKSEEPQSKRHWLNTKTNVRHNSSCRWYENTKGGRNCTSSEGKACDKCGG